MLNTRRHQNRSLCWSQTAAPVACPGVADPVRAATRRADADRHPLTDSQENARLFDYEQRVKSAFDSIVPTLKRISALQHEADFESRAQAMAREQLGFELPEAILADAWVTQLDMRRLFSWCVFETYHRFCDEFFSSDPLSQPQTDFQRFLIECGFHTLDISPCADGRLAHVIRYVLRLPYRAVRRKSYAGALFDIEDSLSKWTETELQRFREGKPSTADAPTRYLKAVAYHFSSTDPDNEGCAAHASDVRRAAQAGLQRLQAFQQAVQNSFCCGASIDLLLIGLDTDSDAICVHLPDGDGNIDLDNRVDAGDIYDATRALSPQRAEQHIADQIRQRGIDLPEGMARLIARLLSNNLSQIDYVRHYHGARYQDIGHAERFIGAGIGFEEVQLRNLTYFAYLRTVEEAAADLDVGVKIFSRLNVAHGLPVPVVVRYDYHGQVPGARDRAIQHCRRVDSALRSRYADLAERGLLHTLLVVRDCSASHRIEMIGSSVNGPVTQERH
ncbi:MAG: carboxysome shell carbonic anhydrase [Thiogranum sp.]|nr:carboxysome shell carbonic anhydrase [Thiogranum sp.]